jgi:cell division protein FtsI/penicillin-binding protein 2
LKTKRAIAFLIIFFLIFIFLIGRLAQIQLLKTENFSKHKINLLEQSVRQRTEEILLSDGRGKILDKSGKVIVDTTKPMLYMFPEFEEMKQVEKDKLYKIVPELNEVIVHSEIKKHSVPFYFPLQNDLTEDQIEQIRQLDFSSIIPLYKQIRNENRYAQHVLGIVRKNTQVVASRYKNEDKNNLKPSITSGQGGLQGAFDEFLSSNEENKLLFHVDRQGNPLFGSMLKYTGNSNPYYPLSIKTTIDSKLQSIAENAMEKYKLDQGALILLNIEDNSVAAMVSRPTFDEKNPYLSEENFLNQAVIPQKVGSVFKLVTLTAAFENNLIKETDLYNCNMRIDGRPETNRPLGMLNIKESFSRSCNNTFAILAKKLIKINENYFEETLKALGGYDKVGWSGQVFHNSEFAQFPNEGSVKIWGADANEKKVPLAVAQTSIGQKDVKISPIAVANIMATIARGGENYSVRIVDSILYKNETSFFKFKKKNITDDRLSPNTIMRVQGSMREVVTDPKGTGKLFNSLPLEVAGKTGTAQVESSLEDKDVEFLNKWFAGYFPFKNPKYVLVVTQLNTDNQTISKANAVYMEVVNKIFELENSNSE